MPKLIPIVNGEYKHHDLVYRIQKVAKETVALWNVTNNAEAHQSYSRDSFVSETWELLGVRQECPECGTEGVIQTGDFICNKCRTSMPLTCKLVAEVKSDETIVTLEGLPQRLTIRNNEGEIIVLERDNMPELALKSIKQFLDHASEE